jgi:hypothetical protein
VKKQRIQKQLSMPSVFSLTNTEDLKLIQVEVDVIISFLNHTFLGEFPGIKIIPATGSGIRSLKSKHSSGYDGIMSKILKACASLTICPLTHICNHLLFTDIFPDHLKISTVRPLCKKGDKTSVTNYGRIS